MLLQKSAKEDRSQALLGGDLEPIESTNSWALVDCLAFQISVEIRHCVGVEVRVARRRVVTVVLEPVQVLVSLAADLASVRLFLLHAHRPRVGDGSDGVHDGEGPVAILR